MLVLATCPAIARDYGFDGTISREVLENYLSRAVTFSELLHGAGNPTDNIRFLAHTGTKSVGRAIYRWGGEAALPALLDQAQPLARRVHQADPEIILQAACFEVVTTQVNDLRVPAWLLGEFQLPVEARNFRYESMIYPDGHRRDHWGPGSSVPDMSQLETRLWFVYLAASYIDVGVEAIHFGQVEIMDDRDPEHVHWCDVLRRVRAYAAHHARRHLVLCDAHVPSGGLVGHWVREHDPNGWLQMPGSRTLAAPAGDRNWYWANTRSAAVPTGFSQEETIKEIWAEHGREQ